jgi:gluconate 2-dehydrogenase gamma chain
MKELTILGFFISKQGASEVLQYNQSPGPYKGCVPLKEVGKTWAI